MHRFKSIMLSVLGNVEHTGSERYFLTVTCFTASLFLMLLCVLHLTLKLNIGPVEIAGSSSLVIAGLYFLVRFHSCLYIPKLILSVIGLIMLDLTWYSKYLSNGPLLFFILIFGALIIWVWEGKNLARLLIFYFLNLAVLFLIENKASDLLFKYPDHQTRSADIYISFCLYSALLIFLLYIIKKDFIRQKELAIKSDKLKSAFLANMSHEIRTPMNAIIGFSELIKYENDSSTRHQYIDIIKNSGDTLLNLINDIIDLSKIEAGDMHLSYSNFSIREMFIELKDIYSLELFKREKSDVQLNYNLHDEDIFIHSDSLRIKQILSNLLSNAIKFTSRGTISFCCEKKGNELVFSVSDTGVGIPEEDQKRIFDRFIKVNYHGMNDEGSGIGLSIVEKIVGLLNGRVWLKSLLGEGTSFFFSIPFITTTGISTQFKKSHKRSTLINPESMKKILVVEDNKASYMLIKEFLRPLNVEIHHVTDGTDAINFIKINPDIRLILMDIKLQFMDGYTAASAIRKTNPNIPIIAQTAYAMIGDREKALKAGCDDYITKPLDINKLQELSKFYLSK